MKKKHFLLTLSLAVMAVSILFGCAVTVYALNDTEDTAVQQTAYGYYDDGYDYDDRYENDRTAEKPSTIKVIGISFVVSAVITGLAVGGIYRGYKYNGKTEPYPYSRKAPLELTGSEDVMIDRQIRRERIERNRQ